MRCIENCHLTQNQEIQLELLQLRAEKNQDSEQVTEQYQYLLIIKPTDVQLTGSVSTDSQNLLERLMKMSQVNGKGRKNILFIDKQELSTQYQLPLGTIVICRNTVATVRDLVFTPQEISKMIEEMEPLPLIERGKNSSRTMPTTQPRTSPTAAIPPHGFFGRKPSKRPADESSLDKRRKKIRLESSQTDSELRAALEGLGGYDDKQINQLLAPSRKKNLLTLLSRHQELLSTFNFSHQQIFRMASKRRGHLNLEGVATYYHYLKEQSFTNDQIVRMVSHDGGSCNLRAVVNCYDDLTQHFTNDQIVKMVSQNSGSRLINSLVQTSHTRAPQFPVSQSGNLQTSSSFFASAPLELTSEDSPTAPSNLQLATS